MKTGHTHWHSANWEGKKWTLDLPGMKWRIVAVWNLGAFQSVILCCHLHLFAPALPSIIGKNPFSRIIKEKHNSL